jgi:hypothetical protein
MGMYCNYDGLAREWSCPVFYADVLAGMRKFGRSICQLTKFKSDFDDE